MAFVPGFEHDVFVSYAHIDNERGGWVSKLVKGLEVRLAEHLGGDPRPSVWIDHKISGNEGAATDPGYDPEGGHAAAGPFPELPAIQVVPRRASLVRGNPERSGEPRVRREDRTAPPGWGACGVARPSRVRLWIVNASGTPLRLGTIEAGGKGRRYEAELTRLAVQLAETLRKAAPRGLSTPREAAMPRVFLAELPDDAHESKRTQVEDALGQGRIEVIPRDPGLVADLTKFEAWARGVLPSCSAFVQLLNANSGKTRGFPKGLPALQFQLATQARVPYLIQWRDGGLALESIANEEHRSLLQHPSVRTGGVQELVGDILKIVTAKEASPQVAISATPSVLVNSDLCDRELGQRVERSLNSKGLKAELPPADAKPRDMRTFLLERLLNWDAAFIVHRHSQWAWVNEQLNQVVEKNLLRGRLAPPRSPAIVGLLKARKTDGETLDADLEDLASYEVGEDVGDGELDAVIEQFVRRLRPDGPRAV